MACAACGQKTCITGPDGSCSTNPSIPAPNPQRGARFSARAGPTPAGPQIRQNDWPNNPVFVAPASQASIGASIGASISNPAVPNRALLYNPAQLLNQMGLNCEGWLALTNQEKNVRLYGILKSPSEVTKAGQWVETFCQLAAGQQAAQTIINATATPHVHPTFTPPAEGIAFDNGHGPSTYGTTMNPSVAVPGNRRSYSADPYGGNPNAGRVPVNASGHVQGRSAVFGNPYMNPAGQSLYTPTYPPTTYPPTYTPTVPTVPTAPVVNNPLGIQPPTNTLGPLMIQANAPNWGMLALIGVGVLIIGGMFWVVSQE